MKNFARPFVILTMLLCAVFVFSSCSDDKDKDKDGGGLEGTYTFKSIYNMIFYMKDGSTVDLRKQGNLSEFVNGGAADGFTDIIDGVDFRFTGDKVYLTYDGEEDVATYKISDGRLNIYYEGELVLTFRYVNNSSVFFIMDFTTFRAAGADISELTDMGISNCELWMEMRKK